MLEGPYRSSRWREHLLSIEGVLQILMIPAGLLYLSISTYEAWINGRYVTSIFYAAGVTALLTIAFVVVRAIFRGWNR